MRIIIILSAICIVIVSFVTGRITSKPKTMKKVFSNNVYDKWA